MLQAVVFHSEHFELSEQFDATTGYEKSVSNLSWSYASFLSAVRAATWPSRPISRCKPTGTRSSFSGCDIVGLPRAKDYPARPP